MLPLLELWLPPGHSAVDPDPGYRMWRLVEGDINAVVFTGLC